MTAHQITKLSNFVPARGWSQLNPLRSSLLRTAFVALVFVFATAAASFAQTLTPLVHFATTNAPQSVLVQARGGNFYGTTSGLTNQSTSGTVFKMTPAGTLITLHSFCSKPVCADGQYPEAGVVQAANGFLYGTTFQGGDNGLGTVYKISPTGVFTTLYSFCPSTCTDGGNPTSVLLQAPNGELWGTTTNGGTGAFHGTIFKITLDGALTTVYSFCPHAGCADGSGPVAGLVRGSDGSFYGSTSSGGAHGEGTIFKINCVGHLTTLHSFDGTDGATPIGDLVQAADGNFYGTTSQGGANIDCDGAGCGTAFKMSPAGTLTTLYNFCSQAGCADGARPSATLVQATDGNLYGTTFAFPFSTGTIFKIDATGTLTTLHQFCLGTCSDDLDPYAGLLQATNGTFYGTTFGAQGDSNGTVYSFSVGLGPFIKTIPPFGMVGRQVTILGNNLASTTSVTFNGTPAAFVASNTEIKTTVPAGATTGAVQVTTASGTLNSNVDFNLVP